MSKVKSRSSLRCFVAMAVERNDTDKTYDNIIAPTLRSKGVTSIRVDRITHNDDIDDRIISELRGCDFAIADLTYARPSVYFEAGFAQRNVPVIYTCRKDHFKPRSGDEFGNFRVHFDLKMKNIIPWSTPFDTRFRKLFSKRVDYVIKPLKQAQARKEKEENESKIFNSLSLKQKLGLIFSNSVNRARFAGYSEVPTDVPRDLMNPGLIKGFFMGLYPIRCWLGIKFHKNSIYTLLICISSDFNKKSFKNLDQYLQASSVPFIKSKAKGMGRIPRKLVDQVLLCSLKSISPNIVMSSISYLEYEISKNEFFSSKVEPADWPNSYLKRKGNNQIAAEIPRSIRVWKIDNIKSEGAFKKLLAQHWKNVEQNLTN